MPKKLDVALEWMVERARENGLNIDSMTRCGLGEEVSRPAPLSRRGSREPGRAP
jgi:hypothetical protein